MKRGFILILLASHVVASGGGPPETSRANVWIAETSCAPMSFDQLATYLAPGQTRSDAGTFTLRARTRDSCAQYQGCSPWLDPATPRMEAETLHTLPASWQITLYYDAPTITMMLTNLEPGARDNQIRMRFADFSPGQVFDQLGEDGVLEVQFLQQPLGGSPPAYAGSVLAWEGSMTGSTHFTGRLCADGSFHLVSALTDGLGLSQFAVDGQLRADR
jgi:hypothetical protein